MGASGWEYTVPYEDDLERAFARLRRSVFDTRDYLWAGAWEGRAWPRSERALWRDEATREEGTHSILDLRRVTAPGSPPAPHTLTPVDEAEALRLFGAARPTRDDLPPLDALPVTRWHGRVTPVFDAAGHPRELYFWGCSGD